MVVDLEPEYSRFGFGLLLDMQQQKTEEEMQSNGAADLKALNLTKVSYLGFNF